MRPTLLLSALCLVASGAVAAPISFNFTSSLQTTVPGSNVTFSATVAETGGTTTFLNGDTVTFPLFVDDTAFFLNFPAALAPFQSVTAPIFTVLVPAGTPLGLYSGTFELLGGASAATFDSLASQTFAVDVVPEPATATLFLCGTAVMCMLRRARVTNTGAHVSRRNAGPTAPPDPEQQAHRRTRRD
jgi:hypothetical protein